MMKKRKIFCLLFVLCIVFSLIQSNPINLAENELPGIGITSINNSL